MDKKSELLELLNKRYSPPVDQLYQITPKLDFWTPWLNYSEQFGLTRDDIPQLLEMVEDEDIIWADYETMPEINDAQIHAWRGLSEFQSAKAIPTLTRIWVDAEPENHLVHEEMQEAFALMGPVTLKHLAKMLDSKKYSQHLKLGVAECIKKIGKKHSGLRDSVVKVLAKKLKMFKSNTRTVNSFLIAGLMDLDAALEHIDLIETAFENRQVDLSMAGDLEEIKINLGLQEERITPLPEGTTNWMQRDAMIEAELEQEALEREQRKLETPAKKRPIKKKVRRLKKGKRKK